MSALRRVLVVEDDDVHREAVHRLLRGACECIDAETGRRALEQLANDRFDCVLLDYRLPDASGLKLLPEIVATDTAVIMLTAAGSQQTAVEAMKLGCQDYLVKESLTSDLLSRALENAIKTVELRRQLALTEQRLERALTHAGVGIWDWDLRDDALYLSPHLLKQLGYEPEAAWSELADWQSALHPDDRAAALERMREHIDGHTGEYSSTFRLRHRDGSYRWFLAQGKVDRDAQGRPLRMIGVHIDVTQRKAQEELLERSYLELQQFAYAASHDLQEPLRAIAGFAELLQQALPENAGDEARAHLTEMTSAARRLRTLLDDLRDYTGVDADLQPLGPTDLNDVVAEVLAILAEPVARMQAEVVSEPLPVVSVNRSQIIQLFRNLIVNALQFRAAEAPVVRIRAERRGSEWEIAVSDNGVGIDPRYHEKIFGVFTRLHHRTAHPGNGIGLAICRRVVQRHGGRLWVESQPGAGSTFRFTLPAIEEPA